jgi:hypothetical protein
MSTSASSSTATGSHLFLTAYGARLDTGTGELATTELAAFVTGRTLITVRKDDGLDIGAVTERWSASPDLAKFGVGYLLHGLLDFVVDGHSEAAQSLDMIPVSPPSLTPNSTEILRRRCDQLVPHRPQYRLQMLQRRRQRP